MPLLRLAEMVGVAPHHLFPAHPLPTQAAVVGAKERLEGLRELLEQAGLAAEEMEQKVLRLETTQPQIQAAVVGAQVNKCQLQMAAPAAPASSSCRMQCQPARPSSSRAQPHGLPPRARPRWTISLSRVAAVVAQLLVEAEAQAVSAQAQVCR
jgi:malonyl CoA-acyl carrier protein transacylase